MVECVEAPRHLKTLIHFLHLRMSLMNYLMVDPHQDFTIFELLGLSVDSVVFRQVRYATR